MVLLLSTARPNALRSLRAAFFRLANAGCSLPVIVRQDLHGLSADALQLKSAADLGGLLLDGFGDGVWIAGDVGLEGGLQALNRTAFGILQATRTRISRTEYISCPSCGRTLFDLQETTAKIRAVTDHLKGIKIGITGCIVNGPARWRTQTTVTSAQDREKSRFTRKRKSSSATSPKTKRWTPSLS